MVPPYGGKCLYILSDQIRPKVQISAMYLESESDLQEL
jgi:hypothetical protein